MRADILGLERDEGITRTDVRKMRERMRKAHASGDPVKHGKGGLVDIDFVAQLGVLLLGSQKRAVIKARGTLEQLAALEKAGWLNQKQYRTLSESLGLQSQKRHLALLSRIPPEPDGISGPNSCYETCMSLLESHGNSGVLDEAG